MERVTQCSDRADRSVFESIGKPIWIIRRNYPFWAQSTTKNVRYTISDEYFRFWFRFIDTPVMKNLAESQQWEMMRKLCKKDFEL